MTKEKFPGYFQYPKRVKNADKDVARLVAQLVADALGFTTAKHLVPIRAGGMASHSLTDRKIDVTVRLPTLHGHYGGHLLIHVKMKKAMIKEVESGHFDWIPERADVDLYMPPLDPSRSSMPVLESTGKISYTFLFIRKMRSNVFPYEAVNVPGPSL